MKAQDWQSQDNNRAEAVRRLTQLCADLGIDYSYTEKEFTAKLPDVEPLPITGPVTTATKRKSFDTSTWGEPGPVEGLPDDLPEAMTPLDEGEPPKGDSEE